MFENMAHRREVSVDRLYTIFFNIGSNILLEESSDLFTNIFFLLSHKTESSE